jgi:hypothetical protein
MAAPVSGAPLQALPFHVFRKRFTTMRKVLSR